jgi:DNA (cytosine-5)-methyltransferase 1
MEQKVTAGTIFGGIGGALFGAKRAGFDLAFNVEPRAFFNSTTFKHNFPGVPYYRSLEKTPSTRETLLIGSPNCKQFSNLGTKRRDRGRLHEYGLDKFDYFKFLRYVLKAKPESFILENVPNVLKTFWFEGNALRFSGSSDPVLVMEDYNIQTIKLNAFDFGVPQNRRRVFIIGCKSFIPNFDLETLLRTSYDYTHQRWDIGKTVETAFANIKGKPNQIRPRHTQKRIEGFKKLQFEESYYGTQNNKRLHPDKPSGVVASHCSRFVHPYESRVLTVRECARLMGFPDHFIFHGTETSQLDQVGKSIVPQVSTALCYYIKHQLEECI